MVPRAGPAPKASVDEISKLKRAMEVHGVSQVDLAKVLGVNPSGVSRVLAGARGLKRTEWLQAMAVMEGKGVAVERSDLDGRISVFAAPTYEGDGKFLFNAHIARTLPIPHELEGAVGGFGIYVDGEWLAPRYLQGEILFLHPWKVVPPGRWVMVRVKRRELYFGIVRGHGDSRIPESSRIQIDVMGKARPGHRSVCHRRYAGGLTKPFTLPPLQVKPRRSWN